MDYVAPRNYPPSNEVPRPSYPDGNKAAGIKGAIPAGSAIEHPIREILYCIEQSGQEPSGTDLTQLWKALVYAAQTYGTASEDPPPSLDFSKTPIMPEVVTGAGLLTVNTSGNSVIVADGGTFVHRGGNIYDTDDEDIGDRTFATAANKTYHLRWRYNGGTPVYELKDLADSGYNAGALAESHTAFDSTYDTMLIARVTTSGAGTITVTALKNLATLTDDAILTGTHDATGPAAGANAARFLFSRTLNWARAPTTKTFARAKQSSDLASNDLDWNIGGSLVDLGATPAIPVTRYALTAGVMSDYAKSLWMHFSARA